MRDSGKSQINFNVQTSLENLFPHLNKIYYLLKRQRINKTKALIEAIWFRISNIFSKRNIRNENERLSYAGQHLTYFYYDETPVIFKGSFRGNDCLRLLSDDYKKQIVSEADNILNHRFTIFGQTVLFNEIDWHLDSRSGHRWPLKYYKRLLPVFNTTDNTDGKVPYELSRLCHLSILGIAYSITGDNKYSHEVINEIESWHKNNPYPYGINWTCAMDVSIRVCNILLGLHFIKNPKEIPDRDIYRMRESFLNHGNFIMKNLEYAGHSKITTNHYLADIAGLVYLGIILRDVDEAKEWHQFGIKELITEIEKQVYSDGCNFEGSTCYHRLSLELLFFSTLVVVINDNGFSGNNFKEICLKIFGNIYTDRLYKMFEVVLNLLKPNGQMPQIGDNDSGRLHVLGLRNMLDMRYLLSFGAIFFNESKFRIKEYGFCEDVLWFFGEEGLRIWNRLSCNCLANVKSRAYSETGWHIMRNGSDYCLISCGRNGGDGWHSHNDKLSFELVINGQDVIVDPGTYVYTSYPEERNKFRSTAYHNTIAFDGYEQNDIAEETFLLRDRVEIINAELNETDEKIRFAGEIRYEGIKHRREIIFDKKIYEWQIKDSFSCVSRISAELVFHLSPDLTFNGKTIFTKEKHEEIAAIDVEGYELAKETYDYSPEYGVKVAAEKLTAKIPVKESEYSIVTKIKKGLN